MHVIVGCLLIYIAMSASGTTGLYQNPAFSSPFSREHPGKERSSDLTVLIRKNTAVARHTHMILTRASSGR